MNITQAKSVPLEQVLAKQGYTPKERKKGGKELWYLSPFREEETPSFVIDTEQNIWNDFAETGLQNKTCAGGKVIDYLMLLHNTNVKGALREFNRLFGTLESTQEIFGSQTKDKPKHEDDSKSLKLLSVKDVFSKALLQYLECRKINLDVAKYHIAQVQYEHDKKKTKGFGLGLKNVKGGYEVRNKFFKGVVGEHSFSFVKGSSNTPHLQILEGVFDFLSLLTIYNKQQPSSDVIVLNGTGMMNQAIEWINVGFPLLGQV